MKMEKQIFCCHQLEAFWRKKILACHLPKRFSRPPKPQRQHKHHHPGCEHYRLNVNIKPKIKIRSPCIIEAKMHKGDSSDMIYTNMLGIIPSIFPSFWISPILCHQNFHLSLTMWTCLVLSLLALLDLFSFYSWYLSQPNHLDHIPASG